MSWTGRIGEIGTAPLHLLKLSTLCYSHWHPEKSGSRAVWEQRSVMRRRSGGGSWSERKKTRLASCVTDRGQGGGSFRLALRFLQSS